MILKNLPDVIQICWTDHRRKRFDPNKPGHIHNTRLKTWGSSRIISPFLHALSTIHVSSGFWEMFIDSFEGAAMGIIPSWLVVWNHGLL